MSYYGDLRFQRCAVQRLSLNRFQILKSRMTERPEEPVSFFKAYSIMRKNGYGIIETIRRMLA